MGRTVVFIARQAVLISLAALAYFGVRGLTESDPAGAYLNADQVLRLERLLQLDLELGTQALTQQSDLAVDLANWVYIWGHWPVIVATLVALAIADRPAYFELRNAMFISGAIGLVIFATYAVTPPRLFSPEYIDTVTVRSTSYRVLQPPTLVNKFAAIPSLHVGWNLLVGVTWIRTVPGRWAIAFGVAMPLAMAVAVVATANHWVIDVIIGCAVGLAGLAIERRRAGWWPAGWPGGPSGRSGRPRPDREPTSTTPLSTTATTSTTSNGSGASPASTTSPAPTASEVERSDVTADATAEVDPRPLRRRR